MNVLISDTHTHIHINASLYVSLISVEMWHQNTLFGSDVCFLFLSDLLSWFFVVASFVF